MIKNRAKTKAKIIPAKKKEQIKKTKFNRRLPRKDSWNLCKCNKKLDQIFPLKKEPKMYQNYLIKMWGPNQINQTRLPHYPSKWSNNRYFSKPWKATSCSILLKGLKRCLMDSQGWICEVKSTNYSLLIIKLWSVFLKAVLAQYIKFVSFLGSNREKRK